MFYYLVAQSLSFVLSFGIEMTVVYFCTTEFMKLYLGYTRVRNNMTPRQRAYVLSLHSSGLMSLFGMYFNWVLLYNGFDIKMYMRNMRLYQFILGKMCVHLFTGYLLADLVIGWREYRSQVQILTGYVHHVIYVFINVVALYTEMYPLYAIFMIAEIPTFILAMGSVYPRYRSDTLFGISFALTRIVYFVFISLLVGNEHDSLFTYFTVPILGLHVYWFYRFVMYQIKEYHRSKKSTP